MEGIKLLEVDSEEMLQCIKRGGAVIKAVDPTDKVVLCTTDKTFAVKSVETSNSVFLVEDASTLSTAKRQKLDTDGNDDDKENEGQVLRESQDIVGGTPGPMTQMEKADRDETTRGIHICTIVNENWEIEHIAPDVKKLDEMLRSCPFGEADLDDSREEAEVKIDVLEEATEDRQAGFTLNELKQSIQASEVELLEALHDSDAIEIGERWGLVSQEYLDALVDVLVSKVSPSAALPMKEVLNSMASEGFGHPAVGQIVLRFLTGGETSKLNVKRVSRFYAKKLLQKRSKWKLDHFLQEWEKVLPVGVVPQIDMLEGLVLKEILGYETEISYLDISLLPREPKERFEMLFQKKERWPAKELKPFLRGMVLKPGSTEDDLLLEFCHSYHKNANQNNPLMYSLKVV